eukprot:1334091-Pleurochrysis_carterae.AAC.1
MHPANVKSFLYEEIASSRFHVQALRCALLEDGVAVVQLYHPDDPIVLDWDRQCIELRDKLRDGGLTAHGSKSMAGIVKQYGVACDPNIVSI